MSSEDRQNNPSSLDEPHHSNQSVAAAESISVSVGSCDSVSIECSEPPPQEMAHPPQEMAQPPIGLVIEFPENSDSASTEDQLPLGLVIEEFPENSDSASNEEQLPLGLVIEEFQENSDSASTEEQLPLGLVIEEVQENSDSASTEDQPPLELVTEVPGDLDSANTEEQPPLGLVIEEVPENSESVNTDNHSVQPSIPSNPIVPVLHISQSIRDDNWLHQFTERLTTYSCWPSQIPQHREDMALAGFYYTGCGDRVRCAFCDLELAGWTKDVEPFSRHKHENPRCSFMEEIRHRAKMLPTSRMNMTSLIDEEVVKELLEWGFQWIDVERAVTKLICSCCRCHCTDDITVLEVQKYLFQSETENEIQHAPNMRYCMVCHLDEPNILFLPCCHICCCQSCGEKCYLCSFCHRRIKAKKKIYIS